jgi:hypothetical protein
MARRLSYCVENIMNLSFDRLHTLPRSELAPQISFRALTQAAKQSGNGTKSALRNGHVAHHYLHVQRGDLLIGILATTSSATLGVMFAAGPSLIASVALLVQSVTALAFCSSVVEIANGQLSVRYGPGWVKRKVAIREIVSCGIVISPLAYGWGVRHEARGYSWRLSQAAAVELHLKRGRVVRIGTDRPFKLVEAVNFARACA